MRKILPAHLITTCVIFLLTVTILPAQNVGIGAVSFTPVNRLDVKGNAVIGTTYSGTNAAPPNGMLIEGNTAIGNVTAPSLFSVGAAAEFRINNTGNITRVRNIPYSWPAAQGANTSVLTNDGAGNLTWQSPTATLYNQTYFDYNTAGITANNAGWQILPGLTRTFTITAPAKLLCHTDGGIQTTSTATNGFSAVDVTLFLNGAYFGQGGYERVTVVNNFGVVTTLGFWSKEVIVTLPAGTYTVDVRTLKNLGSDAIVGGNNTSVLQGVLITQVIYQ